MAYTKITKPSTTTYSNTNKTIGREIYDDDITYDSSTYYDGINNSQYNYVNKSGFGGFLLKEDGLQLLLETGGGILLEADYETTYTNVTKPI